MIKEQTMWYISTEKRKLTQTLCQALESLCQAGGHHSPVWCSIENF